MKSILPILIAILTVFNFVQTSAQETEPFRIQVIDAETGRGVPLVELKSTNSVSYVSDSAGNIAFDDEEFFGQQVWFAIKSHGYEYPKDGFGFRGKRLKIVPGGSTVIRLPRINIAERLYRVTGSGIYRDTIKLGLKPPKGHRQLNGKVMGSDSIVSAVYNKKLHLFWGDTNRPEYPLGNFHVPGAVAQIPQPIGFDPAKGLPIEYFVDKKTGFAKETCKMPGEGPTWLNGLCVVKREGKEVLLGKYVKVAEPLHIYEKGIVQFNDAKNVFEKVRQFEDSHDLILDGHTFQHPDNGNRFVYSCNPFPVVRVPADFDSVTDPNKYQSFSYFDEKSTNSNPIIARDQTGKPILKWREYGPVMTTKLENQLVKKGLLMENERYFKTQDIDTRKRIEFGAGSCKWNPYRKKWIVIATQAFGGPSFLGEVYYLESDDLTGPWETAKKIVTHDKYSFYNPLHHPYFDQEGGRVIYFEGTYTTLFTQDVPKTPRYDYNQIMYRLDLSDKRLR